MLGKPETTVRFLHLAMYQGRPVKAATALTLVCVCVCAGVRVSGVCVCVFGVPGTYKCNRVTYKCDRVWTGVLRFLHFGVCLLRA